MVPECKKVTPSDPSGEAQDEEGKSEERLSGLQNYTPSSLLKPGQFEVKIWNNLYSQNQFWDANGQAQVQGSRSNYFATIGNFLTGVTPRINLGFDAWFRAVSIEPPNSSPFRVLTFQNEGPNARVAMSMIGPKVKFAPFPRKWERLSVQSALLIPILKDPTGQATNRPFVERDAFTWWTQIFFDRKLSPQTQIFTELDLIGYIPADLKMAVGGGFSTPMSAFFSYFPTRKITLYGSGQFWPSWGTGVLQNYFFQSSLGAKYQVGGFLDLEINYSRFLFGRATAGPANTFNMGFRLVKL